MEIRGLTKDVPVRTLLEQAESEEQTGTLFLQGEKGIGEISFENGLIYSADSPFVRERIGQRLVLQGFLHGADLYRVLREQDNHKDHLLGELLLENELIPADKVERVIGQQIEESVSQLLTWDKGRFAFERNTPRHKHRVYIKPRVLLQRKEQLKTSQNHGPTHIMEIIEKHPDPQIHRRLYREIEAKVARTERFEPRITVVLVEGDSRMRMMVHDELVKHNFNVKGVSSVDKGEYVIKRLLEKGYSPIVVTDVDFPNRKEGLQLEGLSFMESLHEKHPEIPIFVSTAYPISNLRRKILFSGGVFCLIKPDLSVLSSKNFEKIFGSFIGELTYCLDLSIQQYYQEYYQERADIIKDGLIEDLFNTRVELGELGRRFMDESKTLEALYRVGDMLVKRGDVDRAIESVIEFMTHHYEHVGLFLWRTKYLNGVAGGSSLRADFSDKIKQVSVEFGNSPFLRKLYDEKKMYFGPPPDDRGYLEFLDRFLEDRPGSHFLYPVEVMGKTVALWYADTAEVVENVQKTRIFMFLANLIHLSLQMDMENL